MKKCTGMSFHLEEVGPTVFGKDFIRDLNGVPVEIRTTISDPEATVFYNSDELAEARDLLLKRAQEYIEKGK